MSEHVIMAEEEKIQKKVYIIPTKRKLKANHGDIVKKQTGVKIQKSIANSPNSSEKEEMSEIRFTDNGWNCGRYKLTMKSVMIFDRLKTFEERYVVENVPIVITDDAGMLLQLTYKTSKKQNGDIIYGIDEEYEVGTIDDYNAKYFNFLPVIRDFVTDYPLLFRNDGARDTYIAYTNEGVHILSQIMIEDIECYKKLVSIWKLFSRVEENDSVPSFRFKTYSILCTFI